MTTVWTVRLICCGREDGSVATDTWEQADTLREEYTSGLGVHPAGYSAPVGAQGHRRAAIITSRDAGGET